MDYLYPQIVQIEISDMCNMECVYCDFSKSDNGQLMEYDDVVSIIKQATFAKHICPQFWGEPTLHPRFVDILKACRENNKTTSYYTNGALLDKFDIKELLQNTTKISISMDVCAKEDFYKVTKTDFFERVKANIIKCWEIKKKYNLDVHIIIRATKLTKKEEFKDEFKDYWQSYCDEIQIKPLRFANRRDDIKLKEFVSCDMVLNHCLIKRNGDMILCCSDHKGEYKIGNVYQESILELFNSEKYNYYRNNLKTLDICANCWYRY